MFDPGDVVLAQVQFTDTYEVKVRPAVVLFEDMNNIVVAGITSNPLMKGVPLPKSEGAEKDSVIKLNYLFTISNMMVKKRLFALTKEKKKQVFDALTKHLKGLVE